MVESRQPRCPALDRFRDDRQDFPDDHGEVPPQVCALDDRPKFLQAEEISQCSVILATQGLGRFRWTGGSSRNPPRISGGPREKLMNEEGGQARMPFPDEVSQPEFHGRIPQRACSLRARSAQGPGLREVFLYLAPFRERY